MPPTAQDIRFDQKQLMIRWDDGQIAMYDLLALRKHCASAQFEAIHSEEARRSLEALRTIQLLRWTPVGHYAIELHWSDGYGPCIYSFDRLWSLFEKALQRPMPLSSSE